MSGAAEIAAGLTKAQREALVSRLRDDELITINTVTAAADQIEADGQRIEAMGEMIEKLIDTAVEAETARITTWLKAHGMRQIANGIERGEYK